MATTRKLSEIVTEICTRLNDPDLVKYANSSTYIGRASAYFFLVIREMLDNPRRYGLKEIDYRGAIQREEVAIGDASTENGLTLFSSLSGNPEIVLDVYTNPDSSNTQLPYNIVTINEEYPSFAVNVESKNLNFYTPKVDVYTDRGWYLVETGIQLYPKEGTGTQSYYFTVKYIDKLDFGSYDKDTEFYVGATDGLFSLRFIDKAIDLTVARLLQERNI